MSNGIPNDTIRAFARSIWTEADRYGFRELDFVRLVNAILDIPITTSADESSDESSADTRQEILTSDCKVDQFPLRSRRLEIRRADPGSDRQLLESWLDDEYGRHFLLSSSTAQPTDIPSLLTNLQNQVGIVWLGSEPVGAVAFLDIDSNQRRAELRKLIGSKSARGQGLAEEATRLWIQYGGEILGLEKIYVSTLQTHLRNIKLNESIGFKVEGVLQREVLIEGERYDVLRMGLCFDGFSQPSDE